MLPTDDAFEVDIYLIKNVWKKNDIYEFVKVLV